MQMPDFRAHGMPQSDRGPVGKDPSPSFETPSFADRPPAEIGRPAVSGGASDLEGTVLRHGQGALLREIGFFII